MSTPRPLSRGCLLVLLFTVSLLGTESLRAQEPPDQDKTGRGATGKKQPLPAMNDAKTSSDPGKKPSGDGTPMQPSPTDGKQPSADNDPSTKPEGRRGDRGGDKTPGPPERTAYDYELPGPDGKPMRLADYKGDTLLIVNLARNSSYNAQLPALEKLQQQYKEKGLLVIGVPSNEFGAAEPGTDPEIQKVYKTDSKVTFPVAARSPLVGVQELPFYLYLTKSRAIPENGPVHWNYTKFLVDKTGKVVARFDPDVAPDSPELTSTLEQVLSGRFKPRPPARDKPAAADAAADDDDGGI